MVGPPPGDSPGPSSVPMAWLKRGSIAVPSLRIRSPHRECPWFAGRVADLFDQPLGCGSATRHDGNNNRGKRVEQPHVARTDAGNEEQRRRTDIHAAQKAPETEKRAPRPISVRSLCQVGECRGGMEVTCT